MSNIILAPATVRLSLLMQPPVLVSHHWVETSHHVAAAPPKARQCDAILLWFVAARRTQSS